MSPKELKELIKELPLSQEMRLMFINDIDNDLNGFNLSIEAISEVYDRFNELEEGDYVGLNLVYSCYETGLMQHIVNAIYLDRELSREDVVRKYFGSTLIEELIIEKHLEFVKCAMEEFLKSKEQDFIRVYSEKTTHSMISSFLENIPLEVVPSVYGYLLPGKIKNVLDSGVTQYKKVFRNKSTYHLYVDILYEMGAFLDEDLTPLERGFLVRAGSIWHDLTAREYIFRSGLTLPLYFDFLIKEFDSSLKKSNNISSNAVHDNVIARLVKEHKGRKSYI